MGWFHAAYAAGELDGMDGGGTCALPQKPKKVQAPPCPKSLTGVEVIYHMCEKNDWEEAVEDKIAYFPSTFHKDGKFTRASVYKEGLIDIANHFYKESSDETTQWICLELNLKMILDLGIVVLPQEEEGGGGGENTSNLQQDEKEEKKDTPDPVQCFQIYAGISTIVPGLVNNIYPMKRGGCGTFLTLEAPVHYDKPKPPPEAKKEQPRPKERSEKEKRGTQVPGVGNVPSAQRKKTTSAEKPEQPPVEATATKKGKGSKWFGMGNSKK